MNPEMNTGTKERPHSILTRKSSTQKMVLKEKVVQIYEAFFHGEDPSSSNSNFWDELFLLKVNTQFIESEIDKLNGETLLELKENLNLLFYKATQALKEESNIRKINALHTLCALVRGIFRKNHGNYGFDVINILVGFDSAESTLQSLIDSINSFLTGEFPISLKQLSLKFMLVLVTATDNISQNTMLEYVLINSVFESLVQILANRNQRPLLGQDAVLLLTLLVQYRKYEAANPYIVKLSILDDELALTGYAQIVSQLLSEFNRDYVNQSEEPSSGWFSALASMVGSMFVGEEKKMELMRANDSLLLALYEAVHLNRNFITALTHSHTPSSATTPPLSPVITNPPPLSDGSPLPSPTQDRPASPQTFPPANVIQPTNLLVTFLQYSSIVTQETKDLTRYNNAKLCLIILTCIAEDQYANSIMHDANMTFRVLLHKMPMRHRKGTTELNPPSRPLICSLLDLMVEFILSHLMKTFPMELYIRSLGIIHRVLCYQKKLRVRIQYPWKALWTALILLLKFLLNNENNLVKKHNIFQLATKVVTIFNLFVTYGDTFLPNPTSYDELYYEIIRMHQIFDNVYSMALRYTTTDSEYKDSAAKLTSHLVNIRAIINHFSPKVDAWAAANHLSSLTEEQVLEVVRGNYDTLTLKLQDSLDQFERYSEKPREMAFFTNQVRTIICDVRKSVSNLTTHQHDALQELSLVP
ncbi:armadillo-like helical domain-containing protein 3 [Biomphalaria glabrata]|uniref:Armadillo-like helical domain-containing protein 3 n=2 Tax=Biomphalaria glabrata TaxID=6526 RepID=A0A2C9LSM4_BIOGL|nr:armadillo-like helical domain-containing protein 3 [Biomphalaria glabrata]XP_055874539.1 armadillo-like helical domain-containing protein 3 [Biomphalaria glabrata]XP_055874544.1 armadillo-like helical domain-containing protein 3 [Biomphalaria glabrata]